MRIVGEVNLCAAAVGLCKAAITLPARTVTCIFEIGVLRDRDSDASVALDLVAAVTKPCRSIAAACQVSIWWQIDLQAEIINLHIATKAVPSLSRRVEISAIGHDDLKTSRIIDLLKPM